MHGYADQYYISVYFELQNYYSIHMTKPNALTTFIFLIIFLFSCSCYSIDGPWRLQIDNNFFIVNKNSSIVFNFQKSIVNGKIDYSLSILACSVLEYRYEIKNSDISFDFQKIGISRSQCKSGELQQIISKMQKIAFTSTVGNILMFLSPSGKVLVKLSKIQTNKKISNLAGVWQVNQILDEPASQILKGNSSVIQFCGGNATVEYQLERQNIIDFAIKQTKGCALNSLFTELYRARYIRYQGDQILLYNLNGDMTMKWSSLADLPLNAPLSFAPAQPQPQKNNITPVNSATNNPNNSQNSKSVTPVLTNSVRNQDILEVGTLPPAVQKPAYLQNITKQDVLGAWYLMNSNSNIMSVLSSSTLMMYGQCGTWFTVINAVQAQGKINIFNIVPRNTVASCMNSSQNSNIFKMMINLHHLTLQQNSSRQRTLQFWSLNGDLLSNWSNTKQK